MKISRYWKAVVAALAAGTSAMSTAANDGAVSGPDAVTAVLAVLGTLGLTWWVPNREPKAGRSGTGPAV